MLPIFPELESLPHFKTKLFHCQNGVVTIGDKNEITIEQHQDLKLLLHKLCPWKKGPFNFFDNYIDAEWRAEKKWFRVREAVGSLEGKVIADIGAHNGYYMFNMLEQNPEKIIGLEPVYKFRLMFQLMQNFLQSEKLEMLETGIEKMDQWENYFDTVFCMGILYHHTDPLSLLRKIYHAMKKDGVLIVESVGIPGNDPVCLFPENRYARGRGYYFIPTQSALENWLSRTQFRNIETFSHYLLTSDEQRRTEWADIDSLQESFDPQDSSKTAEGYPAQRRIYVRCIK